MATNAERQRRYIERLKARADAPHSPDMVLAGLAKLKPIHLGGKAAVAEFARLVRAQADRLSPGSDTSREIRTGVSNTAGAGQPKPAKPKMPQAERNARAAAGRAAAKIRKAEREAYDAQIRKDNKARIRKLVGLKAKAADSGVTAAEAKAFSAKAKELEERGPRTYSPDEFYAYKGKRK
jgi:hypothetical protein